MQFVLLVLAFVLSTGAVSAAEYESNQQLGRRLKELGREHKKLLSVSKLATTLQGREVWMAELGSGSKAERAERPGMLVVAGIEGNDLAGSVSILVWAEGLLESSRTNGAVKKLLAETSIYIVPRLNPDAVEQYFGRPKQETLVNALPVDDDHDGAIDEDGPEDLDKDGLITWMRVEDPEGEYILDSADARLLLKAERAKGESGAWRLFSEGIDNDKDEAWNEDALGGVNFNRNFPFQYKFFAPSAGLHQVSEPETRALADFAVAHPNIGIAFCFGSEDNLSQSPKTEGPWAVREDDLSIYRELGRKWRETLGLKKELPGGTEPGTFADWIYFHRGRFSVTARPWSPALAVELFKPEKAGEEKKESKKPEAAQEQVKNEVAAGAEPGEKQAGERGEQKGGTKETGDRDKAKNKPAPEKRNEEERAYIKWLDDNAPELVVPWRSFNHPDFPGKKVEIGGFAPFAKSNPPGKLVGELARKHSEYLTDLAGRLPRIHFRKAEARHLGNGIYEVTLQVENKGYLPTVPAQDVTTRAVLPTRVTLKVEDAEVLGGTRRTMLPPIAGSGGMRELRYILHLKDRKTLEIEAVAALAGSIRATIQLQEAR